MFVRLDTNDPQGMAVIRLIDFYSRNRKRAKLTVQDATTMAHIVGDVDPWRDHLVVTCHAWRGSDDKGKMTPEVVIVSPAGDELHLAVALN